MRTPFFTWADTKRLTGGTPFPGTPDPRIRDMNAVTDDSRRVVPGALFVAIEGELTDGHRYLAQVVEAQAGAVCVSTPPSPETIAQCAALDVPCLQVPDTLAAFHALSREHRARQKDLLVVAVTGSCGKTSSKEMIAAVLEEAWPGQVLKTKGNTNNHFGVPRNLLRLTSEHRAAILELGSNHPGEIASLTALVSPDIGVVCNIGRAHLEFFGDTAGVAREKGDILAGTAAHGTAIYPHEAEHVNTLRERAGARRVLTFGRSPGADVSVAYLGRRHDQFAVRLTTEAMSENVEFVWRLGGIHQAMNAAGAAAVGKALGLSLAQIAEGLRKTRLPGMRMSVRDVGGVHWVNDAYNANPDSTRAALLWFGELTDSAQPEQRVIVLGDMLELHPDMEAAEHTTVLEWTLETLPGARIVAVGPRMCQAADERDITCFADAEAARGHVQRMLRPGDWVLLKGSRGIHLEHIAP